MAGVGGAKMMSHLPPCMARILFPTFSGVNSQHPFFIKTKVT
jgi:hypothetical protein